MADYWILANAFSTHCCCWTSSTYCWLTTSPLPVKCLPHLLCLGPSMHVARWQMILTSLQCHPLLWDWRRRGTEKPLWVPVVLLVQVWLCLSKFVHAFVPIRLCFTIVNLSSVLFSSVAQLCLTLFDSMEWSTPGFPVHHQLPELTQTHVHWVSDAVQPSHPLPSPSPPTFNPSQHQGLFQWVSSSNHVAKVLEFQLQH